MNKFFHFGETVAGYDIPVLNEREVRAAAGILFFFAITTFMNAFLLGNFYPTQVFIVAFLIDFSIRIFINPSYAPTMIIGRFAVRNQTPDYVGAPQKRFAWIIGFALALFMFYLMVLNNNIGPVNMLVCSTCLILMFFEAAFGICLGCMIYNRFSGKKAQHCAGGVCETQQRHPIQTISWVHTAVVAVFVGTMVMIGQQLVPPISEVDVQNAAFETADPDCIPPAFAVAMGHAEKWKLHHGCQ
ncbi:MAG: hypothetical protein BWK73_46760 [Thiothrix lacustris]|uniref:DUF4395 domain-containing protein n=1 Tax=Thiothrix lacustris TaxID=525917 RepID=A0A1Y1QA48_9GAMM|nr:MAG: hypothetical protein BWK73_46760 [Thiothrix lacustris]